MRNSTGLTTRPFDYSSLSLWSVTAGVLGQAEWVRTEMASTEEWLPSEESLTLRMLAVECQRQVLPRQVLPRKVWSSLSL